MFRTEKEEERLKEWQQKECFVANGEHLILLDREKIKNGYLREWVSNRWIVYDISERSYGEYCAYRSKRTALACLTHSHAFAMVKR